MKHAPLLLLIAWLSMACASEMPEPANDAPDRQAARSEVAEQPSPVVDPQTAPLDILCGSCVRTTDAHGGAATPHGDLTRRSMDRPTVR